MALLKSEFHTRHLFDLPPLHRKVYQVGYSIPESVFAGPNECFLQWYFPVSFFHKDPTVISAKQNKAEFDLGILTLLKWDSFQWSKPNLIVSMPKR